MENEKVENKLKLVLYVEVVFLNFGYVSLYIVKMVMKIFKKVVETMMEESVK